MDTYKSTWENPDVDELGNFLNDIELESVRYSDSSGNFEELDVNQDWGQNLLHMPDLHRAEYRCSKFVEDEEPKVEFELKLSYEINQNEDFSHVKGVEEESSMYNFYFSGTVDSPLEPEF
ncbi:MAG: hypothetical protein ABEK04_01385 [Candidatus Nanohalobium sp.]